MVKEGGIRRRSASELATHRRRGESRTDPAPMQEEGSAGAERLALQQLEEDGFAPDWFRDAHPVRPEAKKLLSLRLDSDVVEWFRNQGAGYQSRMNAVLRSYMTHARRQPAASPVVTREGEASGR